MTTRLSVVVPAHNEEDFLGNCLDSLLDQDYPGGYEIIVVDNNSTDGTARVASARGVTVVSELRPGVCWARQSGTVAAAGEIVVSTDADTVYDRGWLSRIDAAFLADPALVAVAGPCRFVDAPWWGRMYAGGLFRSVNAVFRATGRVPYAAAANIAFRKASFCGYDTRATQGGDELGLLHSLRGRGRVRFDAANPVFTSSRRMRRGLAYNFAVTFLFYYLIGYSLNRMSGRTVVGMAPSFRTDRPLCHAWLAGGAWLVPLVPLVPLVLSVPLTGCACRRTRRRSASSLTAPRPTARWSRSPSTTGPTSRTPPSWLTSSPHGRSRLRSSRLAKRSCGTRT
jgi:glycosyltransferase involved in cell wall biosynthesis